MESQSSKSCCCIDHMCYRTDDVQKCSNKGGKMVSECKDCH
jgi:hypothetical protein